MKVPDSIRAAFPERPADAHKYTVGTVAVVGGSSRFAHAPVICGLGARAAGAGLVHLVVPDASQIAAACLVPEATLMKLAAACVPPRADVLAVGMGLGIAKSSEKILSRLLSGPGTRFVLDADSLTILASWRAKSSKAALDQAEGKALVLTPHSGEAARLLASTAEDVQRDRAAAAHAIAERYRATCVLKGSRTIVVAPDGRSFTCEAGNPFMAMGGMGDLLSGVLAARWARTGDPFTAACAAVWLHASASDDIVGAATPQDPSIMNTAARIGSLRVALERGGGKTGRKQ